jgi:hypothetical protein
VARPSVAIVPARKIDSACPVWVSKRELDRPVGVLQGGELVQELQRLDLFASEQLVRETWLTEREVSLAAAYCYCHPEEIAAAIARNNRIVDPWHELHPFAEIFATG